MHKSRALGSIFYATLIVSGAMGVHGFDYRRNPRTGRIDLEK
ncbi:hypothetical protein O6R05_05730 [Peptoniphilus equinus]|uniref:Uncharacterized protein n=1 Tax=Peptoniphilus equinus TaxID=3016343 RepID=A0ABY7QTN9_9FIRM|nr:hypothetical protein [Peptoniphilus equinus]WBW49508.1 hypothetical protein O6R05_05730 [Peptoniphilus equinus]